MRWRNSTGVTQSMPAFKPAARRGCCARPRPNSTMPAARLPTLGAELVGLGVEQLTRFELVVIPKTARAIGLAIPNAVLLRADEVPE